jgi:glycerol-3-phosphate dehydrogenase subunit C
VCAPSRRKIESFDKTIFKNILKDEGYFSSLDPLRRVALGEKTFDVGEYLLRLHRSGELMADLGPLARQAVYFPPCHQREQEFGQPYLELLALIPGLKVEGIQGNLYCCGLAGVMGFKRDFHEASLRLGGRLMRRIGELNPETLLTDCLSCRIQFNQGLRCEVRHPIELLAESYRQGSAGERDEV